MQAADAPDRIQAWTSIRSRAVKRGLAALAAGMAACGAAGAQTAPQPLTILPPVTIVGASPIAGSGVGASTTPAETSVLGSQDLDRGGTTAPDMTRALAQQVGSVNLDSASGNPYQPTLLYHGYEASALQGTPQGLAVYVNGIRFNQAFGDTVNFDLLPSNAMRLIQLEGSNPVYGLNALGGALRIQLKDGFSYQGGEMSLSGGSFGTVQGDAQYGRRSGNTATYVALTGTHQGGWRDLQSSDIQNFYGDIGWRGRRGEVHVNVLAAHSILNGPGTAPVALIAADPAGQFTAPNLIQNDFVQLSLSGTMAVSHAISLQAVTYYNNFLQRVANGNASNDVPCQDGSGLLCYDSGYSTTTNGAFIPAFLGPSPFAYSELDNQTTNTNGYGVSVQMTDVHSVFGFANRLVAGFDFDGAQTEFTAASQIGGITPVSRVFIGPGVTIDEPGTNQPVRAGIGNAYYGAFLADTFKVTPRLALTASGRFNAAAIDLNDQGGGSLTGNHHYDRFNPAIGASYRLTPWMTAYAGYAEANRAPTPAELSCASPASSCSLANFFVGDPDLKQVVAHTVEAGLRGDAPFGNGRLSYDLSLYRSNLDNDIVFINSAVLNRAYFANVGQTRRQGVDISVKYKQPRWSAYLAYSYTDATYQSAFTEAAGNNPAAADGTIGVAPGDRLPGVPLQQAKLGVTYRVTPKWTLGAVLLIQGSQYLYGDPANQTPPLPGFATLDLSTSYQITPNIAFFAYVNNVADTQYYTYGTFSPTSAVYLAQAPNATNPRSYSIAAPIGGFAGLRVEF